jgi:hypothetical protein
MLKKLQTTKAYSMYTKSIAKQGMLSPNTKQHKRCSRTKEQKDRN